MDGMSVGFDMLMGSATKLYFEETDVYGYE
jgi:hypothetical protein